MKFNKPAECRDLLFRSFKPRNRPQPPLRNARRIGGLRQGEDTRRNLRGQAKEHEDLGHPGATDAFPTGDVGLGDGFSGVESPSPFDSLAEGFNYGRGPGRLGLLGRLGPAAALGNGTDNLAGGYTAGQATNVAVLEGPFVSQGNIDSLFAVGRRIVDIIKGYVYNTEPDLRFRDTGPVSRPTHSGTRTVLELTAWWLAVTYFRSIDNQAVRLQTETSPRRHL